MVYNIISSNISYSSCLGSFGSIPRVVQQRQRAYQDAAEATPDTCIRFEWPKLLDESREAVAKILNVPTSTVVMVANATMAVNIILRNIVWNEDGKDEIIYFSSIYGACGHTIQYLTEYSRGLMRGRKIALIHPEEDEDVVQKFKDAIKASRDSGKRPRLALYDTVNSAPGARMPFEALTKVCAEEGIFSLVDGAQGIGQIPIDLGALQPDFFLTNAHKWFFVPRGCAVLYVPEKNQHLIRSTIPTAAAFIPLPEYGEAAFKSSLPTSKNSPFVGMFEFTGTSDYAPPVCIPTSIKFREEVCGGEAAIMNYCRDLTQEGGKKIAQILGTKVLDNKTHTMSDCCMTNVLLPISISPVAGGPDFAGLQITDTDVAKIDAADAYAAWKWMESTLIEFKTYIPVFHLQGQFWARLGGQVYLELSDFEWAGHKLKEICERVGKGEYKN